MGDVGSILLGFTFSGLVVSFSDNLLDFLCLSGILFPFYADELITMAIRIKAGDNLRHPHRKHLYQLLANEMKIDHWKITAGYGIAQILVGINLLIIRDLGLNTVLSFFFLYFIVFICFTCFIRVKIRYF